MVNPQLGKKRNFIQLKKAGTAYKQPSLQVLFGSLAIMVKTK
jgi:hypothetical protein